MQAITIDTNNDAPVGVNNTATAKEASGTGNGTAGTNPTGNVLTDAVGKDSDPEGDVITVKDILKGTSGTATAVTASSKMGRSMYWFKSSCMLLSMALTNTRKPK